MNVLIAEGVSKAFGERVLFKNLDLNIAEGQKVALVAKNGAGKSSLLKILSGRDTPDSGKVILSKEFHMGYLPQEPELNPDLTVIECVLSSDNILANVIAKYEVAMENHAEQNTDETQDALQNAMNEVDALKAWDYENKVHTVLSKLKIIHLHQKVGTLSGGQKKRVALAKILVEEPGFIIMDEPTNHLDMEMIEWLEDYTARMRTTLLLVTHDRYFLDRITNEIIELEDGKLYKYTGNYGSYLEKKELRMMNEKKEVDTAKNLLRKELEWMRRQPKARGTKSKARIADYYETEEKANSGKKETGLNMEIRMERLGGKILDFKMVSKGFEGKKLIDHFSYVFKRRERVGIVGPNGAGKSTLLNMIAGLEQPDSGKINVGETIVMGYYTQAGINISGEKRVLEVVQDIAEYIPTARGEKISAKKLLEHFGFESNMLFNYVSKLSGGERRRLYLLTILMKNPNFLILDEPTNDLDINTLNTLEEFLENYEGCLVVVSHDRYFLDRLVDHLFILDGAGNVKDYNGNYTDYRTEIEEAKKAEYANNKPKKVEPVKVVAPSPTTEKKKAGFKEKREYEDLEKEIEKLETKKKLLETKLSEGSVGHEEILKTSSELGNVIRDLEGKTNRWLELAELF